MTRKTMALASTLADWPPLLELNTGRLQAQGQLDLPALRARYPNDRRDEISTTRP